MLADDVRVDPASPLAGLLKRAMGVGASDLHLHSSAPVIIRRDGALTALKNDEVLQADRIGPVFQALMGAQRWDSVTERGQIDFVCSLEGCGRFRTSVCRQQRGIDAVFRLIPPSPPSIGALNLPPTVSSLTDYRTGMVLCTGPTGCGKSTTLAALVNSIANSRREHILTLEDPIEFIYSSGHARVNQRQIRRHSRSFASALRAALREDPDVISVAELRDRETIALALTAAETGHLVLGTLHTATSIQTIDRLISAFGASEQPHIRVMVSDSLRAVVSQRLVRRQSKRGRVPAVEILLVTPAVSNLIREGKTFQIPTVMQVSRSLGMQTMSDALKLMVDEGVIAADEAQLHAPSATLFE